MLLGAYVCLTLAVQYQVPFALAFPITLVFSATLGILTERIVLRPMIGEPVISLIMVTLGLSALLKAVVQAIWGADLRPFPNIFPVTPVEIGPLPVSQGYLYGTGGVAVLLLLFSLFFKFTRSGIAMRATAFSQQVALSMGISV